MPTEPGTAVQGDEVAPPHLQAELADAARHLQSGNRGGAAACLARLAAAAHRDGDLHYNCGVLAGALGLLGTRGALLPRRRSR